MDEKDALRAALRAYVEDVISHADLGALAVFSDQVWLAGEIIDGIDPTKRQALIDACRKGFIAIMGPYGNALRVLDNIKGLPLEPGDEMPDDLMSVGEILRAWSAGRISDDEARQLMELDADDDLYEIAHNNWILPPDPVRRRDDERPDDYARRMRRLIETVARIVRHETGTDLDTTKPTLDISFALENYARADWHDVLTLQAAIKARVSRMADIEKLTHVLDFVVSQTET